ncbi:hypothetical protein [Sphingobium sp. SCG-1]|uniref:hypothetical protein n=1 Tax=Sphingobium sp. SCG-1 TaxID=2072936 RepID=UPI001CB8E683
MPTLQFAEGLYGVPVPPNCPVLTRWYAMFREGRVRRPCRSPHRCWRSRRVSATCVHRRTGKSALPAPPVAADPTRDVGACGAD